MDEATRISLKDQFNSLLVRAIEGRRGGMALMRVLEELDFYNSPASAKHHLNVPGGLVLHSLNVARAALELCDKMPQFAKCNKDAVLTAALLHDVCKAGQYIKKPDGSYRYEDSHLMGHGEASVSIIKDWIFLTDTEALAIRWHMGAYSGEQDWGTLSKVYDRCPEALCLHMADMIATHIMYPTFAIWENVPGAFSSNNGEDFRAVLEELARVEQPNAVIPRPPRGGGRWSKAGAIAGNGWSLAWRQLDSQYFGVAQRRKRIALILDLGGQRAGEILFERTSLSRHPDPCIPAWKEVAGLTTNCSAGNDRVVAEGGAERSLHLENTFGMRRRRQGCAGADGENRDTIDTPRPNALPTDSRTDILH